jgi:DNA-binding transcriptional MerR regulator
VLRAIKAAQRLGFTLDEIAALLGAGRRPASRVALPDRARAKLAEVEARIADLAAMRADLAATVNAGCDDLVRCAAAPACPIFDRTPA